MANNEQENQQIKELHSLLNRYKEDRGKLLENDKAMRAMITDLRTKAALMMEEKTKQEGALKHLCSVVGELQRRNERLTAEVGTLNGRCRDLEAESKTIRAGDQLLRQEASKREENIEKVNRDLRRFESALTEANEERERLKALLKKTQTKLDELQNGHSIATPRSSQEVEQLKELLTNSESVRNALFHELRQAQQLTKKQQQEIERQNAVISGGRPRGNVIPFNVEKAAEELKTVRSRVDDEREALRSEERVIASNASKAVAGKKEAAPRVSEQLGNDKAVILPPPFKKDGVVAQ